MAAVELGGVQGGHGQGWQPGALPTLLCLVAGELHLLQLPGGRPSSLGMGPWKGLLIPPVSCHLSVPHHGKRMGRPPPGHLGRSTVLLTPPWLSPPPRLGPPKLTANYPLHTQVASGVSLGPAGGCPGLHFSRSPQDARLLLSPQCGPQGAHVPAGTCEPDTRVVITN